MSKLQKKIYLLPTSFRYVGILLTIISLVLLYIRFSLVIKPEFLDFKVFAVYSFLLESKYFTFTTNHFSEEIAGLLMLAGLFLIAFASLKNENENTFELRLHSLYQALIINLIISVIAFFTLFGLGFIYFLVGQLYLFLIIYILIFYFKVYKQKTLA